MKNYTYPHVSMKTTALKRSSVGPAAEDTTILFAPIIADRGPTDGIVICHTLSEFIDIFGELSYKENGRQAFNVYNWLSNGGTVYARRLVGANAARAKSTDWEAKYVGDWYNKIKVYITERENLTGYFDIIITYEDGTSKIALETFYRVNSTKFKAALEASRFIQPGSTLTELSENSSGIGLTGGSDGTTDNDSLDILVKNYFTENTGAYTELANKLETPIDIILDAGFKAETKSNILKFTTGLLVGDNSSKVGPLETAVRPDIITILETDTNGGDKTTITAKATNLAVYTQTFTVYDATFSDQNVKVGPTYFLSKLIPSNDLQYGIQFPTAGLRRGILADALAIDKNPTPDEKQANFKDRINYAEKTSREYAFMSQRTHDGSTEAAYTALSFLNNSRCLEKMKKELERLGREYLFEFNDSITLSQLSSVLNKYMGTWVANRTLNYAVVDVRQDEYSSEKVNIFLNIRFTGTIEIIAVDITIE